MADRRCAQAARADTIAHGISRRHCDAATGEGGTAVKNTLGLAAGSAMASMLAAALAAYAQPPKPSPAVIAPQELNSLCTRLTTVMQAGGVSVPDLQRAAPPAIESTRPTCYQLPPPPNR